MENEDSILYMRTVQASAIRTLSEALKEVLIDVNIHFDNTGLRIISTDQYRIAFIHLKLDANKFENFYCQGPLTIGVNMLSFHKLLKTIGNSDIISFYILKNDDQKLGIRIENKEKKIVSVSKLKLLDLTNEGISIPVIKFESIFHMPCSDFQSHCRNLSNLDEWVDIYTKNNGEVFTMKVNGDFADQEIDIGEPSSIDIMPPTFIGRYQLKYLILFCKSAGLCPTVEILLKESYPMLLMFSVANLGSIKYGLAPKNDA
jgi:proliferating cell nuclear antigen PCNA